MKYNDIALSIPKNKFKGLVISEHIKQYEIINFMGFCPPVK